MTPTARPTGDYESIDNEQRNMYEMVSLHNGAEGPIVMKMRDERGTVISYGTLGAGETKNVPKFVGEYQCRKNSLIKIVDGGDPEAIRAIETDSAVLQSSEQAEEAKANIAMRQRREAKVAQAERLAGLSEQMQTEADNLPETTDQLPSSK